MRLLVLAWLAAVSCWAAPLRVQVSGWLLAVDDDGDEQLLEAETVKAGDVVVYEVRCRNKQEFPVKDGIIEVPIPQPTRYLADSATQPQELTFSCSIDGGKTFQAEPIKINKKGPGGKQVAAIAGPARYTHLRWELPEMAPRKEFVVSFRSEVQEAAATMPQTVVATPRRTPAAGPVPERVPTPTRERATVLAWPAKALPLLTEGQWRAPKGWADQFPANVAVTGKGVRLDFSSQTQATRWSKAVAACGLRQVLDNDQVIALDVFSSLPGPAQLALGMQSNVFVESTPVSIRPGLNRNVLFDLQARNYKSEASNWAYRTALQPKFSVREFYLIFYPQGSQGTFEIRGARLHEK